MPSGDFKNFFRWTASDKVLHDKLFNIVKNPKYDGYKHRFASMVYNLLGKKSATYTGTEIYSENQQLAEELHKLIIRKF